MISRILMQLRPMIIQNCAALEIALKNFRYQPTRSINISSSSSVFFSTIEKQNLIFFIPSRSYAKGKDKKKDNKKATKVEINETQINEVLNLDNLNKQMQRVLDQMKDEFIKNLSLRSTTGSIETLKISADGEEHELQELAQISRKNPKTIVINMIAFPQIIPDVLKAIEKSGLNLNPQQDGTTLFIPIPKVTKEHRELLSKNAKGLFIKCRDGIKDVQNQAIKKIKRKEDLPKDDSFAIQNQLTSIGNKYITEAEQLLILKQNELIGGSS